MGGALGEDGHDRPGGQRREGGPQADRPGDPVEHDVGADTGSHGGRVLPDHHLRCVCRSAGLRGIPGDRCAQLLHVATGGADQGHVERHRLLSEEVEVATGGERDDGEAPLVAGDDVQGLGADGAGGAEQGDGAGGHGIHCQRSTTVM